MRYPIWLTNRSVNAKFAPVDKYCQRRGPQGNSVCWSLTDVIEAAFGCLYNPENELALFVIWVGGEPVIGRSSARKFSQNYLLNFSSSRTMDWFWYQNAHTKSSIFWIEKFWQLISTLTLPPMYVVLTLEPRFGPGHSIQANDIFIPTLYRPTIATTYILWCNRHRFW